MHSEKENSWYRATQDNIFFYFLKVKKKSTFLFPPKIIGMSKNLSALYSLYWISLIQTKNIQKKKKPPSFLSNPSTTFHQKQLILSKSGTLKS